MVYLKKIFISTSSFGKFSSRSLELLNENNINFELNGFGRTLSEEEIISYLKDKDGLIAGTEPLNENVFNNCKNLKVISRVGVGLNNIDLESADKRNILILNTPDGPTNAVAELTLGLILNLLRHIGSADQNTKMGKWEKKMGILLLNKKIGIVGYGRIGKRLAELLRSFNCEIYVYDPFVSSIKENDTKCLNSLDELLGSVDIVTLHLPYTKENHHLINESRLKLMKRGSFLINAARGGFIDEDALFDVLKNGCIAGAALDTFEKEPYEGRLRELDNVILTPHIGSYARESRIQMETDAVINLLSGFENV